MVLLPHIDLLETCFNRNLFPKSKKVLNAIYNDDYKICFSKKYIETIENRISNRDAFQALIRELFDKNRLTIEETASNGNIDELFIEIAINSKYPLLVPISEQDNSNNAIKLPSLTVVNKASPVNRHWLILELLSSGSCNVSYIDFKNDNQILDFIKDVFSIPKFIRNITIFNRDQNPKMLPSIKGKNIEYYTYFNGSKQNEYLRRQSKKDLQKSLGGKLKLFYTSNPRKLHERKIIFEDILVTFDNSHENLTIGEPTWEIFISFDKNKSAKWREKCIDFKEVRG